MARSRARSRTGCKTCRIRRVKCDETRPVCTRCLSTGRKCDGYDVCAVQLDHKRVLLPRISSSPITTPSTALVCSPRLTPAEEQGFVFFCEYTSREAGGSSVSAFWQQLVLQLAHQEAAVLHAAIGVGAMHRSTRGQSPSLRLQGQMESHHTLGLAQYIKAIRHLRGRLEHSASHRQNPEIALVVCLLFIYLEMLQRNRLGALVHLQNGLRVLTGIPGQVRRVSDSEHQCLLVTREQPTGVEHLTEIFARLDIDSTSFGQQAPVFQIVSAQDGIGPEALLPVTFRDAQEARHLLDRLKSAAHHIRGRLLDLSRESCQQRQPDAALQCCVEFAGIRKLKPFRDPSLFANLKKVETDLLHWLAIFHQLNLATPIREGSPGPPSHVLLELQCHAAFLQLATCHNDREASCDQFNPTFQRIVDLCRRFIGDTARSPANSPKPSGSTFMLEPGLIPALYLTALKCRQSDIRQEAISLLYQYPCQEGMWEPALMAQFVQGVSGLEEEAVRSAMGAAAATEIGCEDVVETARFCDVVLAVTEQTGQGRLVCARYRHETTRELEITDHFITIDLV
ncbi:hypothetical protein P170DRAFT_240591 [Aspergillus steynii IBT 23096]|uniref:Zn(2)-C6 fungal-type domain-containing protein n=1 Tax=Aspergillus steynii IBT 23096 TaxID=1392250 RepID=A0A2I2G3F0_9EURO|nr:uncharacterized protein P170DRAFT_240591 [Aspergillus steynii IBT 23096]PLB47405.1 hypothetical protein P170DRAFT_240591 [Aspergillus steynii IBT 23096]